MVWLWKRKPAAHDAASAMMVAADTAVEDAVATAQQQDKEWRRQAARLRQEEKRREKQVAKQAKRELALMKKQARAARKAQAKAQKLAKKQANAVRKAHKRELKIERKRVKTIAKLRRSNEKHRKRMLRKRQKEERRRRKRMQVQDTVPLEPEEAVATAGPHATATTVPLQPPTVPLQPPTFKEDKRCKSCHSQFSRLPMRRRHHCRNCGESFCSKCLSATKRPIPWFQLDKPQKVCFSCDVQVFNGMGGATSNSSSGDSSVAVTTTPPASTMSRTVASPVQPPLTRHDSPVRVQRSASFQSEQPEDSPRTASPPSSARSGLTFRLRSRSTQRAGTTAQPKTKKSSRWTLPIRPLLKRKASADQLRNRTWDLDLRIEKEEMLARQRRSQMVQFATAS